MINLKKWICGFVVVVFLSCILGLVLVLLIPTPPPPNIIQPKLPTETKYIQFDESIFNEISKHSVSILGYGQEGAYACSGVIINIDNSKQITEVLTCSHCVNVTEEIDVEGYTSKFAKVSSIDDLAILIVDGIIPEKTPVTFAKQKAKKGDTIYHIGYPDVYTTYKSKGVVFRYTRDWGYANISVIHGCSGGGIFNTNLELIGIIWGDVGITGNIGSFESITDIEAFIKSIK